MGGSSGEVSSGSFCWRTNETCLARLTKSSSLSMSSEVELGISLDVDVVLEDWGVAAEEPCCCAAVAASSFGVHHLCSLVYEGVGFHSSMGDMLDREEAGPSFTGAAARSMCMPSVIEKGAGTPLKSDVCLESCADVSLLERGEELCRSSQCSSNDVLLHLKMPSVRHNFFTVVALSPSCVLASLKRRCCSFSRSPLVTTTDGAPLPSLACPAFRRGWTMAVSAGLFMFTGLFVC